MCSYGQCSTEVFSLKAKEVERLIDHKKKKDGMYFLIRWADFTSKDDTWERESNLVCFDLLNEYKQKMNLQFHY